ncbi:hypothetical protein [Janthinobacterium sp. JC611]|uniref:hypothetical protein n=1 Tax=Janthinobacterium sp. JC611 TaxID=2816201 RepID=UPI001BFE12AF|nr:hypothetical protein [Janthinobacterium sp. JC611]
MKADNSMPLVSVPGDQVTLLEKAPTRPSNDLMAYITANTGGNASPYVLTPGRTYVTGSSPPAAPEGTKRVTITVDGAVYFPLVAPCPAVSCTNGDPIANAIPDAGTKAYNEAVARKTEREVEIFTSVLGLGGAAIRGAGAIVNLATKTSAVARVVEVAEASSSGAKLSFDTSLNTVDKAWSVRTGEILAEDSVARASYARLQRQGTDVKFVNDPHMPEMGLFDPYSNVVTVNMLRHSSAEEAASTVVHEALHQNRFFQSGVAPGTQFEEYLAFRNEFLFQNVRRPTFMERQQIINDVVKPLYPQLPSGNLPTLGGK